MDCYPKLSGFAAVSLSFGVPGEVGFHMDLT